MTNRREGREGREREGERDRERGSRAKPGIQLVIYIAECVYVCVSFRAYTRRRLWSDHDQIWHTHSDSSPKGSGLNKKINHV